MILRFCLLLYRKALHKRIKLNGCSFFGKIFCDDLCGIGTLCIINFNGEILSAAAVTYMDLAAYGFQLFDVVKIGYFVKCNKFHG